MNCYYYKTINTSRDPILKNADLTVILMMENSTRFKYDPFILNLSKKTVIQYNKGFRACKKPDFITKSNEDLNHAYYTAFKNTQNYNNVIFLEEDAEVLYYDRYHYDLVDKYISGNFDIFSFAHFGTFTEIDDNFYSSIYTCGAHAQIISKSKRKELINEFVIKNFQGHVDADYFLTATVYKHPLIVQLFPETENRSNWNTVKFISTSTIKLLNLDTDTRNWEIIYFISKLRGRLNFIILLIVIILIIIFLIYRKKSILK